MSWTRLESSAIAADLSEGLQARIADPLWLLARQWQSGEFKGDDAANPLLMRIEARSVRIDRLVRGTTTIDLNLHTLRRDSFRRRVTQLGPARMGEACRTLRDATPADTSTDNPIARRRYGRGG